jgi:hypothetical protein
VGADVGDGGVDSGRLGHCDAAELLGWHLGGRHVG